MRLLKKWENSGWTHVFEAPFFFVGHLGLGGCFLFLFHFQQPCSSNSFTTDIHQNFEKDINFYLQQKSTIELFHPFFLLKSSRNPWALLKSDMWTFSGGIFEELLGMIVEMPSYCLVTRNELWKTCLFLKRDTKKHFCFECFHQNWRPIPIGFILTLKHAHLKKPHPLQ